MSELQSLDDYINGLLDKVRDFHKAMKEEYPDLKELHPEDWDDQFLAWLSQNED